MKNNKETFNKSSIPEDLFTSKSSDTEWLMGLALISGLFGDWGKDKKIKELEDRIFKLETKSEIYEKILF